MLLYQIIILAVVQGFTEFLPISSSGHLAILQNLWNIKEGAIVLDTILHLGTLGAILFFLRKEIIQIFKEKNWRLIFLIIIASLPAAIIGFLFQNKIESAFSSLKFIGIAFLFTALILFLTKFVKQSNQPLKEMHWFQALKIGLGQALALFPGISRSGLTLSSGLFVGLKKEDSYRFSFLIAIPVILGATLFKIKDVSGQMLNYWPLLLLGLLISFTTGLISLKIVKKVIIDNKLAYFSIYLSILGILLLVL